jgi:hypothetical protein
VYLLESQIETNIWPSICATYKKTKMQIKKWSFCSVFPDIGATKTPFLQHEHTNASFNSLTAIDSHDRQYFNELRSTVVSR